VFAPERDLLRVLGLSPLGLNPIENLEPSITTPLLYWSDEPWYEVDFFSPLGVEGVLPLVLLLVQ
jgi:hypothetical protein